MNPFLCLFVPWLLGWVMILLALGLQWLVCTIGIPALWFHARLAVAMAVQPVEVALYRCLGGECLSCLYPNPRSRKLDRLEHLERRRSAEADRGSERARRDGSSR